MSREGGGDVASQIYGREEERAVVLGRVRERRLVTITGPGGIGKTALAGVVAAELASEGELGTVAVDLTRIDQADAVCEAIAAQLGAADFDSLLESPSDQPALVVVDNCEHVIDSAADAIGRVLAACKTWTVLATSRSPLDLPDESIITVGPLTLPAEGSIETGSAALRMLVERIRDQGVDPDGLDIGLLAEICRRLDGVPLALELAAARLRTTTPGELLTELVARPHALARRRFRGQASHRSVAELVGWSTELLDPDVRDVFHVLGVFAGPFTAELAQGVVGDHVQVREALDDLVNASLVVVDGSGPATRYRLLHPVRAVAVDGLRASGQLETVRGRFVDQVVASAIGVIGRTSQRWGSDAVQDLMALYDNIATSVRWLLEHDERPDRALTLVAVLWGLVHQSHTAEIGRLGEAVLERCEGSDSSMWPDAVATVATCRTLTGRYEESIELAARTLASADRSSFASITLRRVLAQTVRIVGDPERSVELWDETVATAVERSAHALALEGRVSGGIVLAELGRVDDGIAQIDRALSEARERETPVNEAWALVGRAQVLLGADPIGAAAAAEQALARSREIDYPVGRSCSLRVLALSRLRRGDLAGAAEAALGVMDELLSRGGLNDLRLVLDVAAAILERTSDPRWVDLAKTAAELPITTVVVPVVPICSRPATGTVLSTRDACVLVRDGLGSVERSAAQVPDTADAAPRGVVGGEHGPTIAAEGDVIRIAYAGAAVRLNRSKGLADLARLLAHPERDVSCLDLMEAGVVASTAETAALDATARRQYEERVRELQAEIERAEADHDLGTVDRRRVELDFLVDELTAALGLGKRTRMSSDPAERARSAVTQRIRSTIKRIAAHHPALGEHLAASISTGIYCSYRPVNTTIWTVSIDP